MNAETRIRVVDPRSGSLVRMYDRFDPMGAAFGLPPYMPEARRAWVEAALGHRMNVAAFSPAGEIVGHSFLAVGRPGLAELAVFVHQESRRKGVGAALVKSVLNGPARPVCAVCGASSLPTTGPPYACWRAAASL